jgi:hypothetical protein
LELVPPAINVNYSQSSHNYASVAFAKQIHSCLIESL